MTDRLSENTLKLIPKSIPKPAYDRSETTASIVHLGPGVFHRAHQAVYMDDVLTKEKNWAICGVSLNSPNVRDILKDQDFLYTLATLDQETSYRIIGSIKEVLVAPQQVGQVINKLTSPDTRIVSLTITEKGYCLDGQGNLDFNNPAIKKDLTNPSAPVSAIGYIVQSLKIRREEGLLPYTLLSCDNLSENGKYLARAVQQFAAHISADLGKWISDEVRFPSTMVDSITPYSSDALKEQVTAATSLLDGWPIQREAFTQWVVEDDFSMGRPDWEFAGVTMARDVDIFEKSKLRLLNAAHSALAYLGSLAEFETVYEMVSQEIFSDFLQGMMEREIVPSLKRDPSLNLPNYVNSIINRFKNPEIKHQLSQIALDGSQKLPIRVLGTIRENLVAGRPIDRLCLVVAAWIKFTQDQVKKGAAIGDPLADDMREAVLKCPTGIDGLLSLEAVFSNDLVSNELFRKTVKQAYTALGGGTRPDIFKAIGKY